MISVFCDFDGTITSHDSIVFLTERFGGGPGFRSGALARIKSGEWSVFEAIEHELASVTISWEEAARVLRSKIKVDSFFEDFVAWCNERSLRIQVVSSGMRPVVELFIGHLGLEIYAHPVTISPQGWHYQPDATVMKVPVLEEARRHTKRLIYVGDGTSDVCAIPYVDDLFAKRYLADYCEANGVPYIPFDTFKDVQRELEALLELKIEN